MALLRRRKGSAIVAALTRGPLPLRDIRPPLLPVLDLVTVLLETLLLLGEELVVVVDDHDGGRDKRERIERKREEEREREERGGGKKGDERGEREEERERERELVLASKLLPRIRSIRCQQNKIHRLGQGEPNQIQSRKKRKGNRGWPVDAGIKKTRIQESKQPM